MVHVLGDHENATNPPPVPPTPQAPHTISTIKLPILKKVSLIKRTKPGVDTLSFDDLFNNLRVFEFDVKGSTASSSSIKNVSFVSSDNTNSTSEVSAAYGISTSSGHNSQKEGSSSYTDDLMYSFFVNQSSGSQLVHEDLEQVDEFDLEEMDLKWQVAIISTTLKKSKGNQESRRRDVGNTRYKARDNGWRPAKQDEHKAKVTIDEEGVDWTSHAEDDTENYALMAFISSNSGSYTENNPHQTLKGKGIIDSRCLRHMIRNKSYLVDYQDFNGGSIAFRGSKGQITSKGKIRAGKLDFEDVYFVKELQHFNPFFVSQMCDKKNKVLFTYTKCLVLSPDFKLPDESQVLLRVPRQNNMYSFNLENIVPSEDLTCLIAKAIVDESNKWCRRLGHSVTTENQANKTAGPKEANISAGTQDNIDAENSKIEAEHVQEYYVLPLWSSYTSTVKSSEAKNGDEKLIGDTSSKTIDKLVDQEDQAFLEELARLKRQEKEADW
nr:ribonuclease H-like domain-containing protein [Tanacetum cinerariifolium]